MYPHKMKFSFLKRNFTEIDQIVLQKVIKKAHHEIDGKTTSTTVDDIISKEFPFFTKNVDIINIKCAYGNLMIPQLQREILDENLPVVQGAVTILANEAVKPEKCFEIIRTQIPVILSNLMLTKDYYIREKIAMIYKTIATQLQGKQLLVKHEATLNCLADGLTDEVMNVRIKMVETLELLSRNYFVAEELYRYGFIEIIVNRLPLECEKKILVILLETLALLINRSEKMHVIYTGTFEKLRSLLDRKDEQILCSSLFCLSALCQDSLAKIKAMELDLLSVLNNFLYDTRPTILTNCASVLSFITITTPGKLQALKLKMISRLVHLAASRHQPELQILAMKVLNNLSEVEKGKELLKIHSKFIENILPCNEKVQQNKENLINNINSKVEIVLL